MTKPDPSECKKIALYLYCYNLITVYTTATKSSSLLQNLMGLLLCSLWKWDTTFLTEDISENITWYNLRSHGRFLQAQSQFIMGCK